MCSSSGGRKGYLLLASCRKSKDNIRNHARVIPKSKPVGVQSKAITYIFVE